MRNGICVVACLCFVLGSMGLSVADPDAKGGRDYPLLPRVPGFHISDYKERGSESYRFTDECKKTAVEGHLYYIQYNIDDGAAQPGANQVMTRVQDALRQAGGRVIYEGERPWNSTIMIRKVGKEIWVEVKAYPTVYRLTIVERETPVADAASMLKEIRSAGRVPVYGIYFETATPGIKPESDVALSEIAKLLRNNESLMLHVVVHTDSTGFFESNMELSTERAKAVVKALSGKYGISAARLKPHGSASLSPVASNDTDDGRALNRRVELVRQ